jgi:hypothetical protein
MADSSDVTAGINATALQYNNLRKDLVLGKKIIGTESDGATVTIDWSDLTKGLIRTVTLGGNRTLAYSNVTIGQAILLRVVQDGVGSRTLAWPSGSKFPGGVAPTLSTAAAAVDSFMIYCPSSGVYEVYFAGF